MGDGRPASSLAVTSRTFQTAGHPSPYVRTLSAPLDTPYPPRPEAASLPPPAGLFFLGLVCTGRQEHARTHVQMHARTYRCTHARTHVCMYLLRKVGRNQGYEVHTSTCCFAGSAERWPCGQVRTCSTRVSLRASASYYRPRYLPGAGMVPQAGIVLRNGETVLPSSETAAHAIIPECACRCFPANPDRDSPP